MILSFSFENFLSFRDRGNLNFRAGSIKEYPENVYGPYFDTDLKVLKSLALYGANSSGKSNVIKAFSFCRSFILNSSKESHASQPIPVIPFRLSELGETKPSSFEIVFYIDEIRYRYGFQVSKKYVFSEWLFQSFRKKDEQIFVRAKQEFSFEKKFRTELKTKLDTLAEFTNPNSLFLSVLSQFNVPIAQKIIQWFSKCIVAHDSDHFELINFSAGLLSHADYRDLINDIIRNAGLGIENIDSKIKELSVRTNYSAAFLAALYDNESKNYSVRTRHLKYGPDNKAIESVYFDLIENESLGTQKFFGLLGPILMALKENRVLFIDEIDARLHTILLENVIGLFNSINHNPLGAQLVFTSHDTNLLGDKLRRDQMIFVEKGKYGNSSFDSLYTSKPKIRNDASFDKDYIAGKYGAIPHIATQLNLFEK